MASFATVIKQLRKERGLTQDQLAALLGVSRSTIGMYETGSREPDFETSEAIADVFNVDMDYLMGRSNVERQFPVTAPPIPSGFDPLPDMVEIPLVGRIACGEPITAEENLEGYVSAPAMWHATFALLCRGGSMEPTICDGDLVAIKKDVQIENGQIVAVRIGDEATLKRVYIHKDYIELRPENPAYTSIILRKEEISEVAIEGLAVGLCRGL